MVCIHMSRMLQKDIDRPLSEEQNSSIHPYLIRLVHTAETAVVTKSWKNQWKDAGKL